MIRKKGSLIIENMLASAIIMLLLLVICQSVVCKGKWQEMKKKKDEFERITYAVEEELKYNLSIEEVKGLAYNNIISFDNKNIPIDAGNKNIKYSLLILSNRIKYSLSLSLAI